jgi:hypothetical protein
MLTIKTPLGARKVPEIPATAGNFNPVHPTAMALGKLK